ncbi:MAG: glycosyltransferase family protein [Dehalococcoidia bacterium]
MKIVSTIEARMASTRLPGKIMKEILGRPMLELLIERLKRAKKVDEIIVATTVNPEDEVVTRLAERVGVKWFRGSSDDVLDRVLQAAKAFKADVIVEMTGDCPLLDPEIVDMMVAKFLAVKGKYDYVANVIKRTYPRGLDTQVFPVAVLQDVSRITQDPADRENVSLYIYEHPEKYRLLNVEALPEIARPDLRLCVDTEEDLRLITEIYSFLYLRKPDFLTIDVLNLIDENPALSLINAGVEQRQPRG